MSCAHFLSVLSVCKMTLAECLLGVRLYARGGGSRKDAPDDHGDVGMT